MDFSLIAAATGAIKSAYDLGVVALNARDSIQINDALAKMKDRLFEAQDRLFAIRVQSQEVFDQLTAAKQEILELKKAIQEQGDYFLVELTEGNFVMQSKVASATGGVDHSPAIPLHYVCQACFNKGVKSVLGLVGVGALRKQYICHSCGRKIQC